CSGMALASCQFWVSHTRTPDELAEISRLPSGRKASEAASRDILVIKPLLAMSQTLKALFNPMASHLLSSETARACTPPVWLENETCSSPRLTSRRYRHSNPR